MMMMMLSSWNCFQQKFCYNCTQPINIVTGWLSIPIEKPTISHFQQRYLRRIDLSATSGIAATSTCRGCTTLAEQCQRMAPPTGPTTKSSVNSISTLKAHTRRMGCHDYTWLSAEARDAKRRCRHLVVSFAGLTQPSSILVFMPYASWHAMSSQNRDRTSFGSDSWKSRRNQ